MAKRFTDTNKWENASFAELPKKLKFLWLFLCDRCDHAGIWDVNLRLLNFHLEENFTLDEIVSGLGPRISLLENKKKILLCDFIRFQYGELSMNNRAHHSVIKRIRELGPCKDLARAMLGHKDKEQDKDKEQEKDMDKDKEQDKEKDKDKESKGLREFRELRDRIEGGRVGLP